MKVSKIHTKRRSRPRLKVDRVKIELPARPQEILDQVAAAAGLKHSALLGRTVRYGRPNEVLDAIRALEEAHLDRVREVLGLKQAGAADAKPKD